MLIEPIGVGISGMMNNMSGYSGASYGIGVYRKNGADKASEAENTPYIGRNGENKSNKTDGKISDEADKKRRFDSFECQTCKNRRYQDGSDDSGVSFQTPTKVDPKAAGARVRSHEQEHVSRNRSKAEREGNEIVSQSVTIHTGICPECGKIYVSGGTTRTTTRSGGNDSKFNVGMFDPTEGKGGMLNTAV